MKPIINLLLKELNQLRKTKATKTNYDKWSSGWAYLNANVNYTAPNWQVIPYNTIVTDQIGGEFANWGGSNFLQVKTDGTYIITASVALTGGTNGTYNGYTGLFVDKGAGFTELKVANPQNVTLNSTLGNSSLSGTWVVTLKAGDKVQVKMAFGANVSMANSKGTSFSWTKTNNY